ncbi:ATP-binding protein [Cellulosilyticum ruminicola]|nr:ATP-binding protein [Cellulosilyticum ruminicola]
MAKAICIIGESGAGKTTSLRNLNVDSHIIYI